MSGTANLNSMIETFVQDGYAVFTRYLNGDQLRKLHLLREQLVGEDRFISGLSTDPTFVRHVVERAPELALRLVASPLILEFAELAMGPFVQLDGCVLAGFPPEAASRQGEVVQWHRDRHGGCPRGEYVTPTVIVVLCYLQDMTIEFGPLRVIPGSHASPVTIFEGDLENPHPQECLLEVQAGDAVVLHHNLLHSGTRNVALEERRFFSFTYCHSSLRHEENFNGPNCRSLLARAGRQGDRRLMRLLGEDVMLEARINSGFSRLTSLDWQRWCLEDDNACETSIVEQICTSRWFVER